MQDLFFIPLLFVFSNPGISIGLVYSLIEILFASSDRALLCNLLPSPPFVAGFSTKEVVNSLVN